MDVACGPATELTGYIKDGVDVSYTGLDLSSRMLEIARSRHINGHFVMGDVIKMPFNNNTFDIVLLKHLLEHLPEYRKAVIEALRVAEGQVIINFFHKLLPIPFDITIFDRRGFYNNWYSRSRFEEFLKSIGVTYQMYPTLGDVKQTAEVYILERR
ncbi:methyltransferase domain-containing protein [Candidatus Woesearchaeota archaeon]|nr:methyltransferase domain-containing protein [Candidatus Woesearchaeota archaeon]